MPRRLEQSAERLARRNEPWQRERDILTRSRSSPMARAPDGGILSFTYDIGEGGCVATVWAVCANLF